MVRGCVAALACAGVILGGCGGDEAQPRLTHAEYVAQANKICKETERAQEPFNEKLDDLDRDNFQAFAPILDEGIKTTREGYDRLKALSPSAADEARVDAFLTATAQQLETLERFADAARKNDVATGKAVAEEDAYEATKLPLVKRLGIDECRNTF